MTGDTLAAEKNTETIRDLNEAGERYKHIYLIAALLIVAAHFVFTMQYYEPAIYMRDANAYYAQARIIATDFKTSFETESILQYVDRNWIPGPDGRYYSKNPPGFPAVLAVGYRLFGLEGALWANPLMAALSLLALFLVCRIWIGAGWGVLAAALFALNPFANEQVHFAGSHTITIFFMLWGVYFLARWEQTQVLTWAFLSGVFLGAVPTFRYAEILFVPAAALFILLHLRNGRGVWRALLLFSIGVAVFLIPMCMRNQVVFGGFWKTGYAMSGEQMQFGWKYFTHFWDPYLQKLLAEGGGYSYVLGITGIACLCARRETWRQGVLMLVLTVPLILSYMAYYVMPYVHTMRFVLSVFPVFVIGCVWLLALLTEKRRAAVIAVSVVVLSLTALWGIPKSVTAMQLLKESHGAVAEITKMVEENVPPGSIVIADEDICRHLDFVGKWRLAESHALFLKGRPNIPFIAHRPPKLPPGKVTDQLERYGKLKEPELFNTFKGDVWKWAEKTGQKKIYWLARERRLDPYLKRMAGDGRVSQAARVEVHKPSLKKKVPEHVKMGEGPGYGDDWMRARAVLRISKKPVILYQWTRNSK